MSASQTAFLAVRGSRKEFERVHALVGRLGRVRDAGVGTAEDAQSVWFEVLFDKPTTLEQARGLLRPLEVRAFEWLAGCTGRDRSQQMALFS